MAILALGVSCTKEIKENAVTSQGMHTLQTKLVGGNDGEIIPGSILVKLDQETSGKIQSGHFSEISGNLLAGIPVNSFTPALPIMPKNMEVARKYGLDQWYAIGFDSNTSAEKVAHTLASRSSVRAIQYNRYTEPVTAEEVYPFVSAHTKSGETMTFNDPYAVHQWNLDNDGKITEDAIAGADVGVKDAWKLTGGDPSVVVAIFDCAVAYRHEDLADAVWRNEAEINGSDNVDDDGNGFIDDKYGFNFVNCYAINNDYINGKLDGQAQEAVKGQPINSTKGTGHGTHVAGIIGATNNNGKGVSSIAGGTGNGDGVRLMTCQIYEGNSYTTDALSAAAFIYAADNGACIAQCSYGNYNVITEDETYLSDSPLENAALRYFLDPANSNHESLEGNMAIFAAGNHSNPYSCYPGALPYVVSVTAFGCDLLPGGYSNYGPGCNIAAPGGEFSGITDDYSSMILSTGVAGAATPSPGVVTDKGRDKNYVYMQGTSMACPHVSGVVALGISYAKKLGKKFTREELTSLLLTSVNDMDQFLESGTKKFYDSSAKTYIDLPLERFFGKMGTGAVDAWKFLMAIEGTPTVMVKAGEKAAIALEEYCNPYDSYTISIDDASKASLGISGDPVIRNGKLEVECTKVGAGKITLSASVGKDPEREDGIGGMSYSREISLVSRPSATKNGGWL